MSIVVLPVIASTNQAMSTIIDNRLIEFRFWYNPTSDRWSVDVAIDDEYVLYGRRMVTGVDILAPFRLGIGAIYLEGPSEHDEPNRANILNNFVKIYSVTDDEE